MQQVIINLVNNAIQSMSQVTERARDLGIRSARDNGEVLLAVTDSGTGISPETMQKMFTAFFTTKPSGMGMGLSICCSIIEAHNGRIQASNNDGHGATFQFGVAHPKTGGTVSRDENAGPATVIILDDDQSICNALSLLVPIGRSPSTRIRFACGFTQEQAPGRPSLSCD